MCHPEAAVGPFFAEKDLRLAIGSQWNSSPHRRPISVAGMLELARLFKSFSLNGLVLI
ncbi:protein of unknown function [Hyphomicrobium sp. MC1]|nr:protein of unknown function [Hyphomicrobium sp. MC1]